MGFFKKVFKGSDLLKQKESFTPVNIKNRTVIHLTCPQCHEISDMLLGDPKCTWHMRDEEKGTLIPAECPYCQIGLLVCIKNSIFYHLEPFDDAPLSFMNAIQKVPNPV
ncbi:hypothetical protein FCL47_08855 [Desulfopila sp. IMCC35006]|uniref:hypothetical protein n=1 Tax=Desulfopila sp. IMCC35006 TaxID=2569542 RepID=UPI0010AD97F0|nr:hypothetical protein [Desulfopila sp. IMCC35006]TKB26513.1 hypothetical protein FCL47_08855 [Desulfopila sp. IMCC35006]